MKKPKHVHKFLPFSASFLMCSCGQFRATEAHLKDHPPIVEIPADHVPLSNGRSVWKDPALTRTDEQVRAAHCTACGAVAGRKHHDAAYRQITVRLEKVGEHNLCQPCLEGSKELAGEVGQ